MGDGGTVGPGALCSCHRRLGMQNMEESAQGTLTAAAFLHLTKQDVANVSAHQHTWKGPCRAPASPARRGQLSKQILLVKSWRKKTGMQVCVRERKSKRGPFKQKIMKLWDHFPCK